ncbi:GGDEF domain-containing protein [Thiomicrorhabdus sp. zzn3]|uniref:GGDEF domain-containing protein n=1 Tax=Thiomicrorhabdus sp. zzn3 TaxID=3039775 RepID=UPI0024363FD3|nr:GGDEF domain-containing protein [Thiomicrorhabdus sp. zzn3]MDG6778155.1 GGDEF domain-containing protein [Thiomicrorhabdus sp. zzn3]
MAKHYFWLISLSALAIWQADQIHSWPLAWQNLLTYAPYAIGAITVFVSLYLNRMQPILITVALLIVVWLLNDYLPTQTPSPALELIFPTLSVLLPLSLILWVSLPEKGVQHAVYNLFLLALFGALGWLVYWTIHQLPLQWISYLSRPMSTDLDSPVQIPLMGSVVFLLSATALAMRLALLRKIRVLDLAILFVLLLMAFGLNGGQQYGVLAWMASTAVLIVLLSQVFDAHHIAYTDELTGMAGRRALFESFMGMSRSYSVVMIDIDHFKSFNDRYGHDIGDLVLRTVSKVLNQVGSGGKAYRFGGEEFTVVFAGKTPEEVRPVMDELRKKVEETDLSFKHEGKETSTKVTVSMGVACKNKENKSPEEVIKAADQALYQAKEGGRNRVVVFGDPVSQSIKKGQKSARIRKRKSA